MNYINNDVSHKITEIHMLSNTKKLLFLQKKKKQWPTAGWTSLLDLDAHLHKGLISSE